MELRNTDVMSGFFMPSMGNKYFDFVKAAKILREKGATDAYAGLAEDWSCTCGPIMADGKPEVSDWCYLHSRWATPVLVINGEVIECYLEGDEPDILDWTEEALQILNQET